MGVMIMPYQIKIVIQLNSHINCKSSSHRSEIDRLTNALESYVYPCVRGLFIRDLRNIFVGKFKSLPA